MCAGTDYPSLMECESEDDSEEDPTYIDSDATSDDELWLGHRGQPLMMDRINYIRLHRPILEQLFATLIRTGREALGDAFLQFATDYKFYNFVYCNTQDFPSSTADLNA